MAAWFWLHAPPLSTSPEPYHYFREVMASSSPFPTLLVSCSLKKWFCSYASWFAGDSMDLNKQQEVYYTPTNCSKLYMDWGQCFIIVAMVACSQHATAFSFSPLATEAMDHNTGLELEYRELHKHPQLGPVWSKSYSNELSCLCQGIGTNTDGAVHSEMHRSPLIRW